MIKITDNISIDEDDIQVRFIRSPGPGGQHVNKVESAVQIRFDTKSCDMMRGDFLDRIKRFAGKRITADGVIVITANRTRSQIRNKEDAVNRLTELLKNAATVPKMRKNTRPTLASKKRRIEGKKKKSTLKKLRNKKIDENK